MKLKIKELIRKKDEEISFDEYIPIIRKQFLKLSVHERKCYIISSMNFFHRKKYQSSELVGFKVKVGDICYFDFYHAYLNEAAYQHFGLILATSNSKLFVIPMSSNASMYYQSYCEDKYPCGKKHLFRLPSIAGLHQKSVLFLNDAKFINSARAINVVSHIEPKSKLFKDIQKRFLTNIIDAKGH